MKRFNGFIYSVNWLFAAVAGAVLVYLGSQDWSASGDAITAMQPLHAAKLFGGALLVALNLLWLIVRIQASRITTYIIFEKEGTGSLQVSADAIEEILTKCAKAIPEIADAHIKLQLEKGGRMPKSALAHCVFIEVPNLFAVQDGARQTISSRYQEIFPGEQLQIEIIVDRLEPEGYDQPKLPKKKKSGDAKDEAPFVGPRYPVRE